MSSNQDKPQPEVDAPCPAEQAASPGDSESAPEASIASNSEPPAVTVPTGDVSRSHLKGLIEALVFASDHPLSVHDIARAAGRADRKLVRALADELRGEYSRRGMHLEEVAGGLIFRTNPAYAPFVRDLLAKKPARMTRAQLETLAIMAYRQPITRPEIDDIRGVESGAVIRVLLERDFIKILGKKDEPGHPILYGTTSAFLEFFGLKSLKDLPSLREFTELSEDSRRTFERQMQQAPDGETDADVDLLAAAAASTEARNPERTSEPAEPPAAGATGADDEDSRPTFRVPRVDDAQADAPAAPAQNDGPGPGDPSAPPEGE